MGDKVLLTAENIRDADEFVDGKGRPWFRNALGFWFFSHPDNDDTDTDTDADIAKAMSDEWMRGAYVTKWKPGREPKAPAADKWVVGYVTKGGDIPPKGTRLCNEDGTVSDATGSTVHTGGWVVVKAAPPKPAEKPWRRVMLETRGEGDDVEVRLIGDGGVFNGRTGIYASTISRYATPAPDRKKVREMLMKWRDEETTLKAILDYVCGKYGDA